jgi:hypothetical protein
MGACPARRRFQGMPRRITGWKLDESSRTELLKRFQPHYPRIIADHVTLRFGTDRNTPAPTQRTARVIGLADDGAGLEALVLEIGGATERGDGSHYHITWSLAGGRTAKESNDVIRKLGWVSVDPIAIKLNPATWSA